MKILKQIRIDNGKLGGILIIIANATIVFNIGTFITVGALAYNSFLYKYVSLSTGIILMISAISAWFYFYYAVVYPSMMSFNNRQAYMHDSPIQADMEEIKGMIRELETRL